MSLNVLINHASPVAMTAAAESSSGNQSIHPREKVACTDGPQRDRNGA
jgi:hypothetical protein